MTPNKPTYLHLAQAIEKNLKQEILACWYPRAIDSIHGGFQEEYDTYWNPIGTRTTRSLVYQSRVTWVAAQVTQQYPDKAEEYRSSVYHGLACLKDTLWDKEQGGFYWQVDAAAGTPTPERAEEKHIYGNSFGIYACATAFKATHDTTALALAKSAFYWIDQHGHDATNGGYYEAFTRTGKPILTGAATSTDAIGSRYGFKSMNSHIHLLESFTELYHVWPDPVLKARLEEVFYIVRDRIYVEPGYLNLFFTPDWCPVSNYNSFGHDVETAFLLTEASEVLGKAKDASTESVARQLVDHALEVGWDRDHGGFYDHGLAWGPATGTEKIWWTQAEGLNALLLMHSRYGDETEHYFDAFVRQWEFIERWQIDPLHHGWYSSVAADGIPVPGQAKSDSWKDPYHQGRALLNVSQILRQLAAI